MPNFFVVRDHTCAVHAGGVVGVRSFYNCYVVVHYHPPFHNFDSSWYPNMGATIQKVRISLFCVSTCLTLTPKLQRHSRAVGCSYPKGQLVLHFRYMGVLFKMTEQYLNSMIILEKQVIYTACMMGKAIEQEVWV